uniref:Chemokine interleukin-8-like domain-containing protein n=1 Tax=Sinocyclocheilus rhinocerous TaxID=307959 RepID=A0A673JL80_9TELE
MRASTAPAAPVWCCFDFIDFQIPSKRIVGAVDTDSHCPNAKSCTFPIFRFAYFSCVKQFNWWSESSRISSEIS